MILKYRCFKFYCAASRSLGRIGCLRLVTFPEPRPAIRCMARFSLLGLKRLRLPGIIQDRNDRGVTWGRNGIVPFESESHSITSLFNNCSMVIRIRDPGQSPQGGCCRTFDIFSMSLHHDMNARLVSVGPLVLERTISHMRKPFLYKRGGNQAIRLQHTTPQLSKKPLHC